MRASMKYGAFATTHVETNAVQIDECDAGNEGSFDTLPKSNKSREQGIPFLFLGSYDPPLARGMLHRSRAHPIDVPRRGHLLVATHSQLEQLVYTPPSAWVKFGLLSKFASQI